MSAAHQSRDRRRIAGRHFGKIVVTLAVAATAAAISAPGASAAVPADGGTPCVYQTFETSTTYNSCVGALQVLLNDMHNAGLHGPDRSLKTDGIYGNNTYNDVKATNTYCYQNHWGLCKGGSGYTTPNTWKYVCGTLFSHGLYHGSTYYYVANCNVIYPTGSSPHQAPHLVNSSPPPSPGKPKETLGPAPGHHRETLGPTRRYVAMGDSFSSGQGASGTDPSDYLPPAGDRPRQCLRSPHAYPEILTRKLNGRYRFDQTTDFVACASAQAPDLLGEPRRGNIPCPERRGVPDCTGTHEPGQPVQVRALGPDVGLITISVGGDDANWTAVLRQCGLHRLLHPASSCADIINAGWDKAKQLLAFRLPHTYGAIREAAPNATVIVVGYPHLVDEHPNGCLHVADAAPAVRVNFNKATDKLDALIKHYTTQAHFRFVDPTDEFKDHGVCAAKPWIGGVLPWQVRHAPITTFHPNKSGQAGYADVIASHNPDIFR